MTQKSYTRSLIVILSAVVLLAGLLPLQQSTEAVAPRSAPCESLNGRSGSANTQVQFGGGTFFAGETITVQITLTGSSSVALGIPNGTYVDIVSSDGPLSYTFAADTASSPIELLAFGNPIFSYAITCTPGPDSDNDGVRDQDDQCPGEDDNIDVDGDSIPDCIDPLIDSDNDGVADDEDICPGADDAVDMDGDGIPDGCDRLQDSDGDFVADADDQCPGYDDRIDSDNDGIPNDCDDTPFRPGADMVPIPAGAVVGTFITETPLYWYPMAGAESEHVMQAGQSLWVFGINEAGTFYQVLLSGQTYWVPVGSLGPTYDAVWNGTPLPGAVVN